MTRRVTAVLDRPTADTFGMVGLVVADSQGVLSTEGVVGSPSGRVTSDHLDDLVDSGHASRVSDLLIEREGVTHAALWLGKNFADAAHGIGLSVPPVPEQNSFQVSEGHFWFAPVPHVWHVVDFWLLRAFRRAITHRDPKVANLMTSTVPNRPETRAARWLTAETKEAKERELDWAVRIKRDSGDVAASPESLRELFQKLVTQASESKKQNVVGLSALAAGGDKEIAKFVAQTRKMTNASFGNWLRGEARKQGVQDPNRRYLQKLGQNLINKSGELALFLEVLEFYKLAPNQPFVIEGIRHKKVLESIRTMVGEDRFVFAFVERPEPERIERLHNERLSDEDIALVLSDPTEREIPSLKPKAKLSLDLQRGVEVEGSRVVEELVPA